jgi:hypothetical protein
MASNINYIGIDETYPVAGKDNDSQGFRDNFHIIKNNFSAAKSEIEDLQLYGARKDQANNFSNQNITNANFVNCSQGVYNGSTTSTVIDYSLGSYQTFTVNADNTIYTVTGFPGSSVGAGKLTVHMFSSSTVQHSIVFNITGTNLLKSAAAKALTTTVACSQTTASTDYITCASTANLTVNQPIKFSGTAIGGLVTGNTYYVKSIYSATQFSVSSTSSSGVAQDTFQLSDQTGSTMSIAPQIVISSPTNPMVFEFWTTDGGTNILMDYRGIYSA